MCTIGFFGQIICCKRAPGADKASFWSRMQNAKIVKQEIDIKRASTEQRALRRCIC